MPLSLPPLRFCLLCVAVLFAHRVDSFAPAPRCIRNPHVLRAAMPQQCSRLWRAARKSIAPAPIAPAPRNITSSVLFSPRFAAREALLGASVMAAYHPVLMLGSAAGRFLFGSVVGALFSAPTTLPLGAADAFDVGQSPVHVMDNVLKQWVYTIRRSPSGSSWADAPIVGPVAEELAYRGFYQWLAHYCLRLRFGLACACGSFGPRAFRAYVAFTLLGALGMRTPDYREVVTRALGGFAAGTVSHTHHLPSTSVHDVDRGTIYTPSPLHVLYMKVVSLLDFMWAWLLYGCTVTALQLFPPKPP